MSFASWNDAITLAVALLGAVLGVLNTWQAHSANQVKLRVKPAIAIAAPSGDRMFSIEVVNLSSFAVTITEVGFTLAGNSIDQGRRAAVPSPIMIDGGKWPRRLESRQAVSAYIDPRDLIRRGDPIGKAYARTACGETGYGVSPALDQLREAARA